jgi:hypothetical protein
VTIVAVALVAALAVPAMAEVNLTGFYRAKGYLSNFYKGGAGDAYQTLGPANNNPTIGNDTPTNAFVDQRLRPKFTAGDENVKAVLFLESDIQWGSTAVGSGQIGADGKDLEIKNVYVWFKVPDTTLDVTVGMQNVTDSFQGIFYGAADMAGVYANYKPTDTFALRLGGATLYNADTSHDDAVNVYTAEAKFGLPKAKIGANLYYLRDASKGLATGGNNYGIGTNYATVAGVTNLFVPGVDFSFNAGPVALSGFAFAQLGDRVYDAPVGGTVHKTKFTGKAADLRADLAAGTAKVFVEGLYLSGDENADQNGNNPGNHYNGVVQVNDYRYLSGSSVFARNATYFVLPSADAINTAEGLTYSANNHGNGLMLLQAGATVPMTAKLTGMFNAAYARVSEASAGKGEELGVEANATLSYNLQKGLDVAGTAAYMVLSNDRQYLTAGGGTSASGVDNPYALIAKVNYAF